MNAYDIATEIAALDLLSEAGPLSTDDWAKLMVARGFGHLREMIDFVDHIDSHFLGFLPDMRNIALDGLLDGRVLTHRLTDTEISSNILNSFADFAPFLTVLPGVEHPNIVDEVFREFTDEDIVTSRGVDDPAWPELGGLLLPEGMLSDFQAGDLIALTFDERTLRLSPVDGPVSVPDVAAGLLRIVPDGDMFDLGGTVWQLMSDNPDILRSPAVPLTEILADAGIERVGEDIARMGFDFEAASSRRRINMVSNAHGIDAESAAAVLGFMDLVLAVGESPESNEVQQIDASSEALSALGRPGVAALAFKSLRRTDTSPEAILRVADSLLNHGPRRVAGAAHWLRAKAFDRLGDPLGAERALEQSLAADPYFESALSDLAKFAAVRGDAGRALTLLGRMESGDTDAREQLERFLPAQHPELGRNDRCWCGSGRKYKVCHLGKTDYTLEQRVGWLYNKAGEFALDSTRAELILNLAYLRSEHWGDDEASLRRAFDDPFTSDVALFEGGIFAEFITARGALLPADELMLAQQWVLIDRSVHEVESVTPGEGLSLRDVRTGDRQYVSERSASTQLQPGHMICTRVVPVDSEGSQFQIFGGVEPVYPPQLDRVIAVLDADPRQPEVLVELLSARFAPPQLRTREGDSMMLCEASFELGALDGIKRKLSRKYGAAIGNQWTWTEAGRVFGSLTLDGSTLAVEAMSEPRFEALLDAVCSIHPQSELVAETRKTAMEAMAESSPDVSSSPRESFDPADNPEIADLLEKHIRKYEAEWVTESIPALHGLTPFEALADPTRRDDLFRLLDSFPQDERPGAMSVRRLRGLLGLQG